MLEKLKAFIKSRLGSLTKVTGDFIGYHYEYKFLRSLKCSLNEVRVEKPTTKSFSRESNLIIDKFLSSDRPIVSSTVEGLIEDLGMKYERIDLYDYLLGELEHEDLEELLGLLCSYRGDDSREGIYKKVLCVKDNKIMFDYNVELETAAGVIEVYENYILFNKQLILPEVHTLYSPPEIDIKQAVIRKHINQLTWALLLAAMEVFDKRRSVCGQDIINAFVNYINLEQIIDGVTISGARTRLVSNSLHARTVGLLSDSYLVYKENKIKQMVSWAIENGYAPLPKKPFLFVPMKYLGYEREGKYYLSYQKLSKIQQGVSLSGCKGLNGVEMYESSFYQEDYISPDRGVRLKVAVCPFAISPPGIMLGFKTIEHVVERSSDIYEFDSFDIENPIIPVYNGFEIVKEDYISFVYKGGLEGQLGPSISTKNQVVAKVTGGILRDITADHTGSLKKISYKIIDRYGSKRLLVYTTTVSIETSVKLREWDTKGIVLYSKKDLIDKDVDLVLTADCFKAYKNRIDGLVRVAINTAQFNNKFASIVGTDRLIWKPDGDYTGIIDAFVRCFKDYIWIEWRDKETGLVIEREHNWKACRVPERFRDKENVRAVCHPDDENEILVFWNDGWAQHTLCFVGNEKYGDVYCTEKIEYTAVKDSLSIGRVQEGNILSLYWIAGKEECLKQIRAGRDRRDVIRLGRQLNAKIDCGLQPLELNEETINRIKKAIQKSRKDTWKSLVRELQGYYLIIPTSEKETHYVSLELADKIGQIKEGGRSQLGDLILEYLYLLSKGYKVEEIYSVARRVAATQVNYFSSRRSFQATVGGLCLNAKVIANPQLYVGEIAVVQTKKEESVADYLKKLNINYGDKVALSRCPMPHSGIYKIVKVIWHKGEQYLVRENKLEKLYYQVPEDMIAIAPIAMTNNRGDFDGDIVSLFKVYTDVPILTREELEKDLRESLGRDVFQSGCYWSDYYHYPKINPPKKIGYEKKEIKEVLKRSHVVLSEAVGLCYNIHVFTGNYCVLKGGNPVLFKVTAEIYENLLGGYSEAAYNLYRFLVSLRWSRRPHRVLVQELADLLKELKVNDSISEELLKTIKLYFNGGASCWLEKVNADIRKGSNISIGNARVILSRLNKKFGDDDNPLILSTKLALYALGGMDEGFTFG